MSLAKKEPLLEAIHGEMEANADFFNAEPLRTIYIGGGTPSICTPQELEQLVVHAKQLWGASQLEEVTMEANPDDLSPEYLTQVRAAGFDRLSIGVQSFIDRDLRFMNRRHDAQAARQAVGDARRAGFDNITVDLIYGLPGMSETEWDYNLSQAIALDVEHLSAYHLTIEPQSVLGRRLAKGEFEEIAPERSEEQYQMLCERLRVAGYEHYEISNFAKTGRRAVHNGNYWKGISYLGVGPSAHSFDGQHRRWNVSNNKLYMERVGEGVQFEIETLSEQTRYNEYLMTALRTSQGLDLRDLETRFGACKLQEFEIVAAHFLAEGRLQREGNTVFIPEGYFLVSDAIISDLFTI